MPKQIKTLIIDTHRFFSETCVEKLNHHQLLNDYAFKIYTAYDCSTAYKIANKCSQNGGLDLVIMDNYIPSCEKSDLKSSEGLGLEIRSLFPNLKLLITASQNIKSDIHKILNRLEPHGFLLKQDIGCFDFITSVKKTLSGTTTYSKTITEYAISKISQSVRLDDIDIKILIEISNGTKHINLPKYIPLSKSGIEKRKRILKQKFGIPEGTDRELILAAKEKNYI